eukprot:TRINITY_DN473_c0_g1_i13.p1 TRINITY_DN473_c0_g1~~TRINITY_DN473_c0_g1_i13.p1  ORF type:complete len:798 (+),score=264.44 TRINITY_DN473_c0_g1_i13:86-2395(+)
MDGSIENPNLPPPTTEVSESPYKSSASVLETVPLLSKLSNKERNELVEVMVEKKYRPGEHIIVQGDFGNEFFIIQSGIVSVHRAESESKESVELERLKDGDYFGEGALLKNVRRGATATAITDVTVLSLDRDRFIKLVGVHRLDVKFGKRNAIRGTEANPNAEESQIIARHASEVRAKDENVRAFLASSVSKNVLFQNLDNEQLMEIVDEMFRLEVSKDTAIIRQGDTGDYFYVVESGMFEIFVSRNQQTPINVHDPKGPGNSFGELALLYNAPRNATVVSIQDSVLWAVERHAFRRIINKISEKRFQVYNTLIQNVPVIALLSASERDRLVEALEVVTVLPNTSLVRQGDSNDSLYVVITGEAVVTRKANNGDIEEVATLRPGDYFGEKALTQNEVMPHTITAVTALQCVCMDRESFSNLLGSVEDILARANESKIEEAKALENMFAPRTLVKFDRRTDFDTIGILGTGSFATVLLVREKRTGNTFALKALSRSAIQLAAQKQHVMNERNVLAMLDSGFLVKLYGTCKDEACLCFVLEACLAGELFSIMQKQVRLHESAARFYVGCVVLGFESMHAKNIIYRDLKPENLMLADNGYLKIADFGLAKVVTDRTWTVCGTPDYLAPEVVCGQGHGKAVDWWTLGVFVYEMLVGEPPFFDEEIMQTYQKIISVSIEFPDYLSEAAVDLIRHLLNPKPSKRLGAGKHGAADIKNHAWFNGFDWDALMAQRMKPPFQPQVKSREDLSNFEDFSDTPIEFRACPPDDSGWDKDF